MSRVTQPAPASKRLRAKVAPLVSEIASRTRLLTRHPEPRSSYVALLELVYTAVRTTVPLMRDTEFRAQELARSGDPVAHGISAWLGVHLVEELDHSEWLLDDYAIAGGDPAGLRERPGSPSVAAMVGSVHYWATYAHPAAILGYCWVLEGSPPSYAFIDTMTKTSGYPAGAFATFRHHSSIDVSHGRAVEDLIDSLPLSPRLEAVIGMTALQTADLMVAAADELLDALG